MPLSRRAFLSALPLAALDAAPKLKITSVAVHPVAVGGLFSNRKPEFSSDVDPRRRRWFGPFAQLTGAIIVEIRTDLGITGYGMGGGGGAAKYVIDHHLSDLLIGADPLRAELLWDQLYGSSLFYGRKGLAILALSGIDLALWDIAGKHAGKPVHVLLGGPTKDKVPAYYTGFDIDGALALGFRAFKLPVRDGVTEGREGMARNEKAILAAREKIGPDAQLMIDVLCQWDVPYTLEMAKRIEAARLYWIEEPISPDDIEGYARLCREVHGPLIAHGEHEYTRHGFADLFRNHAVQLIQPDTTWCGGLTELRRIAALADAAHIPMVPHRGGSPYGMAVILSTNSNLAESFGTLEKGSPLIQAMTSRFEKGYYFPNEKPGFGVDLEPLLPKA